MYKLLNGVATIKRTSDETFIPLDERNPDYREYLEWVAAGNEPEPADPIIEPPIEVTPRQIRKALNSLGKRAKVESEIDKIKNSDIDTRDWWEYSTSFVETDPILTGLDKAFGKTSEELHELFVFAKGT